MNSKVLWTAIAIVLILAGIFLFGQNKSQSPSQVVPTVEPKEETMEVEDDSVMAEHNVEIKDFAYQPKNLTIKAGESVTWTNRDAVAHSATADDGSSFDTGLLKQNEKGTVKFDKAGTYSYFCTPHPNMKATIIVE